jgi:hypothetical protein
MRLMPRRFRWAAFQIDHLAKLPTSAARRRALRELPPDLYTTYDRILDRVGEAGEDSCVLVQRALHWLSHPGHRNISTNWLCTFIGIHPDSDTLDEAENCEIDAVLFFCGSLVRIAGPNIELAHFTVKEYLASTAFKTSSSLMRYYYNEITVAAYIVETYLRYYCLVDPGKPSLGAASYDAAEQPWIQRSAMRTFWNLAQNRSVGKASALWAKLFFELTENFAKWKTNMFTYFLWREFPLWDDSERVEAQLLIEGIARRTNALHFAALLHNPALLREARLREDDINAASDLGTPLHCAILGGYQSVRGAARKKIVPI